MIVAVHTAASPGLTKSDAIRWIGVAIAVAGTILATPGGIASAWHSTKRRSRKMLALGRRLLRRPQKIVGAGGIAAGHMRLSGNAYGHKWQRWLPRADADLKIDILHQQVDILLEEIGKLHAKMDQSGRELVSGLQTGTPRHRSLMRAARTSEADGRAAKRLDDAG